MYEYEAEFELRMQLGGFVIGSSGTATREQHGAPAQGELTKVVKLGDCAHQPLGLPVDSATAASTPVEDTRPTDPHAAKDTTEDLGQGVFPPSSAAPSPRSRLLGRAKSFGRWRGSVYKWSP